MKHDRDCSPNFQVLYNLWPSIDLISKNWLRMRASTFSLVKVTLVSVLGPKKVLDESFIIFKACNDHLT